MRNSTVRHRNILHWEMWGILFIVLLGGLLHFTFGFSGDWKPLGVISAVNESVWEHLKLAFWPALFWTIIEYAYFRRSAVFRPNFWLAKAIGTYLMPIIIVIIFYSYTSFTGESILTVDLSAFVIAVIIGQIVSYKLLKVLNLPSWVNLVGLAMLVIGAFLFGVFTFLTPHLGIFQDPETNGYGIQ